MILSTWLLRLHPEGNPDRLGPFATLAECNDRVDALREVDPAVRLLRIETHHDGTIYASVPWRKESRLG